MLSIFSRRKRDGGIIRIVQRIQSENSRSVLTALLFVCLVVFGLGCDSTSNDRVDVDRILISKDVVAIAKGASAVLDLTVVGSGGLAISSYEATWTSLNPAIVTVDQEGRVRGLARGKATITATVDNKTDSIEITTVDVSGKWTATVTDPGAPGGINMITYNLVQNGVNVSGTYTNVGGFPPLTSVNVGRIISTLTIGRVSIAMKGSVKVSASPCNLIWENNMTVITLGDGSVVLRPVQDPTPLTSDNCSLLSTSIRVAEVKFVE